MTHLKLKLKRATVIICGFALITIFNPNSAAAQTKEQSKIHIGFIYPLSTNGTHAPLDTNTLSLHVLAGVSAEEKGLAFSGLTNVVRNNARGMLFAGFSNHVGKEVQGMVYAGFANTYRTARGLQAAGFTNIAMDSIQGVQLAGFFNKAGNVKGLQGAGFANLSKEINGSQFAGFANVATGVKGSQFAGFTNVSGKAVSGSQFAGFANVATDVSGSQLSGFINAARKVKGTQLGFINIADSSDHPIGIINISKNGEKSLGLQADETQTVLLTFRSGGKSLYGIIGAGYNFKLSREEYTYAYELGLGAHLFRIQSFRLNTELSQQYLEDFHRGYYFKTTFRLMPSLKLGKTLELFGGPSINLVNTNTFDGRDLVDRYLWERNNRWNGGSHGLYIGYLAGINIHI
ncbi:MAG TPA: hypothetical protein VGB63_10015 [Pedobacter sp.]|jgi:hypothetical protein